MTLTVFRAGSCYLVDRFFRSTGHVLFQPRRRNSKDPTRKTTNHLAIVNWQSSISYPCYPRSSVAYFLGHHRFRANNNMRSTDKNDKTLEVEVERILPGGLGLAHAEGLTLFVSLAAPGDLVRVHVNRVRGKVAFADIKEVVKPSPVRVEPPCPYFGRCGGCDFQQLTYEAQLNAKIEIVRDCLQRIAKIKTLPSINIRPSPRQWQYRARTNWQVGPQNLGLGYFERGSHRVCDVEVCAVLAPELQEVLETLRTQMRNSVLEELPLEIDAVIGDEGVSVVPPVGGYAELEISRSIAGETYQFNAESFFQINHELLESLVAEAIKDSKGQVAVDLYCGVGLFTVPLARRFAKVIGIESNPAALRFARRNLQDAGLDNAKVTSARVGEWLLANRGLYNTVDFLLLDPPRTGAEPGAIEGIVELSPRQICYVSCDPATLARDLKQLLAGGYAIDSVAALDMFPQTHHVETVVHLQRR
jgi:23S rRNA (uracil1939-C5)-methyltransferase